jgi:hypothetical protein
MLLLLRCLATTAEDVDDDEDEEGEVAEGTTAVLELSSTDKEEWF